MHTNRHEWNKIWTAVAERSGDTAFDTPRDFQKSGVALRFPPQSKTGAARRPANPEVKPA